MDKLDGLLKEFEALQDENKILRQKLSELGEEVAEKRDLKKCLGEKPEVDSGQNKDQEAGPDKNPEKNPPVSPFSEKENGGGGGFKTYQDDLYNEILIPESYGISVMSLTEGVLVLTTKPKGGGRVYLWAADSFGEKKIVPYADLVEIMRYQKSFFDKGLFAILSDDYLKKFSLKNPAVSVGTMSRMIEGQLPEDKFLDHFQAMPEYQRDETVRQMVRRLAKNPDAYSGYLIKKVFNVMGVDLEGKAEKARVNLEYINELIEKIGGNQKNE